MVPILNPNYDYDRLLKEMQDAGKGKKEQEEEDLVELDGEKLYEDQDTQSIEGVIQEAMDNIIDKKVDR